jgi:hypothetical protein
LGEEPWPNRRCCCVTSKLVLPRCLSRRRTDGQPEDMCQSGCRVREKVEEKLKGREAHERFVQ